MAQLFFDDFRKNLLCSVRRSLELVSGQ
jgi:hypothetical protein